MSRIDCLKDYYLSLPEVKRLQEIEPYINNNQVIITLLKKMEEESKKGKESLKTEDYETYKACKKNYNQLYEELLDQPFFEEHKELYDIICYKLELTANIIEKEIAKHLK